MKTCEFVNFVFVDVYFTGFFDSQGIVNRCEFVLKFAWRMCIRYGIAGSQHFVNWKIGKHSNSQSDVNNFFHVQNMFLFNTIHRTGSLTATA